MDGHLDERGQPVISIRLAGSTQPVTFLIDTGFDGEILRYEDQLSRAGIPLTYENMTRARLADGSEATLFIATAGVEWHGDPRQISIDVIPRAAPPSAWGLLGCGLLRDSRLAIDFPAGIVEVLRQSAPQGAASQ